MSEASRKVLQRLYAGDRLRTVLTENPEMAGARLEDGFTALHLAAFFGTPAPWTPS